MDFFATMPLDHIDCFFFLLRLLEVGCDEFEALFEFDSPSGQMSGVQLLDSWGRSKYVELFGFVILATAEMQYSF